MSSCLLPWSPSRSCLTHRCLLSSVPVTSFHAPYHRRRSSEIHLSQKSSNTLQFLLLPSSLVAHTKFSNPYYQNFWQIFLAFPIPTAQLQIKPPSLSSGFWDSHPALSASSPFFLCHLGLGVHSRTWGHLFSPPLEAPTTYSPIPASWAVVSNMMVTSLTGLRKTCCKHQTHSRFGRLCRKNAK